MVKVIKSTYSTKKQDIHENPVALVFSAASEQAKLMYNTRKAKHNRKPEKRNKRPKARPKTGKDWNRMYREAVETANNNFFVDNLINTWYVTLTIKDPHIKEVNTVRKWLRAYEKTFFHKVFILGFIELNKTHHPHAHLLLTTVKHSQTELITEKEVTNNWKYGFVKASRPSKKYYNNVGKYHHDYIRCLINYSIKTWDNGEPLTMNWATVKKYDLVLNRLKNLMNYYNEKYGEKWRTRYKQAHSLYLKAKSKYKRELEKQFTVKDKVVYISYGKQKATRTKNPTEEELELLKKYFKLSGTQSFTLSSVNNSTGEITNQYHQHTEYYDLVRNKQDKHIK